MVNETPDIQAKMVLFWHNHFALQFLEIPDARACYTYTKVLYTHAMGNFKDLTRAVTIDPAMLFYLNGRLNTKKAPDENYAREVMQLFSIGLVQLNADGTPRLSNGQPMDSYSAQDISQLARVFTGWERDRADAMDYAHVTRPMKHNAANFQSGDKTVLGTTIPGSLGGPEALSLALDTLANHPNVGPFMGRQLIQRFTMSHPSPAYVARVAARFNDNGAGVRGDLKAVWVAILLDDEARGPGSLQSTTFGKLREPMLRFVQWARTFGVTSAAGSWKIFELNNAASQLGQSPLRSPSVFNFFRPGYVPPGTALSASGATAPEFQLVNETTVGGYLNFMQSVIERGINCPNPGVPQAAYNNYAYDVQANVGGKIAQLGSRLIDSTAKKLAGEFFSSFGAAVSAANVATG